MEFSRIYLKQETRKFAGFSSNNSSGSRDFFLSNPLDKNFRIEIHSDCNGRLYFEIEMPDSIIQTFIHDLIEEIICYVPRENSTKCRAGFYKTKGAEATVEPYKNDSYRISIRGDNLSSILELYRQVRAGAVQPNYGW